LLGKLGKFILPLGHALFEQPDLGTGEFGSASTRLAAHYCNDETRVTAYRITLRSQPKVNTQWHLYCLVHNIEKLAHHGYGG
jgi:hypothetical protein